MRARCSPRGFLDLPMGHGQTRVMLLNLALGLDNASHASGGHQASLELDFDGRFRSSDFNVS